MTTPHATAQVTLPSDHEVEVVRDFRAPRDVVYRAHTEPALLQRWLLGPPGWTMPVCEMDVRVGGQYRWRWRSEDGGREFRFHGAFTEVVPPGRLVHTEYFDPGTVGGDMGEGPSSRSSFESRRASRRWSRGWTSTRRRRGTRPCRPG